MSETPLTGRRLGFAHAVVRGMGIYQAATKNGYPPSTAKRAGRILRQPAVQREIQQLQAIIREATVFDAKKIIEQAMEDREIARQNKQGMAMTRSTELIARVSGLLEATLTIKDTRLDIAGALEAARRRVHVVNAPRIGEEPSTPDPQDPFS
jgi:phage terminase small subunit